MSKQSDYDPSVMKKHMGMQAKTRISNTVVYVVLIVISVIWLAPFVFIVLQSLRVENTHMVGYIVPQQWGFDNYVKLAQTDFFRWYANTFIAAVFTALLLENLKDS